MAEPTTVREPSGNGDAPTAFTAAVSAITDAFGDPTRRRIYLFTRDQGGQEGVTVAAVAHEVGVHPNVCLLYTSPSPRDISGSRMPSSA